MAEAGSTIKQHQKPGETTGGGGGGGGEKEEEEEEEEEKYEREMGIC